MMTHTQTSLNLAVIAALSLTGCGGSDADKSAAQATPEFEADTSYLDDLAKEQGIETDQPAQQDAPPAQIDQTELTQEPEKAYADEQREWVEEEGSKSLLGRSRDRAKNIRDRIQGSTEPEEGIANTSYDEEYAQVAGYAWDMPRDWRMAVPATGRFAEMYIQNPLGNASVVFTKETDSPTQIRRTLESTITDTFGGRGSTRTTTKAVKGFKVTLFDLEGTYIDPGGKGGRNENPFYAIHAAVIELPTTTVLVKMWGPQDTVNQSKALFDKMIDDMYEREP